MDRVKSINDAVSLIRLALAELEHVPNSVDKANIELFLVDALRAMGVQP